MTGRSGLLGLSLFLDGGAVAELLDARDNQAFARLEAARDDVADQVRRQPGPLVDGPRVVEGPGLERGADDPLRTVRTGPQLVAERGSGTAAAS